MIYSNLLMKDCPYCAGSGQVFDTDARLLVHRNSDGTIKHVYTDGSRDHVIRYLSSGMYCSVPECEINLSAEKK